LSQQKIPTGNGGDEIFFDLNPLISGKYVKNENEEVYLKTKDFVR
jgi:hypothetical protein